ncbi:MAG: EamA family transporter [Chloroflexota bacterium]
MLYGLLSALVWGSADFAGGYASRRLSSFQTVVLGSMAGGLAMALIAWLSGEGWPAGEVFAWAGSAGLFGGLGIAMLYRGLSTGSVTLVAPTAALVGAGLPVLVGVFTDGLPAWTQALGLLAGLAGISLVSSTPESPAGEGVQPRALLQRPGLGAAVSAGLAFGAFFILMARCPSEDVFTPLVIAKLGALAVSLPILLAQRLPIPPPQRHPVALLSGVLDAGGNLFYLLATQSARLDLAVLISSMYPATTVLLAALVYKERPAARQWLGLAGCLAALALIVA